MTILSAIDWGWPEMLWTTLISICLVFGILVLLVWIMKLFGMIFVSRRKAAAAATQSGKPVEGATGAKRGAGAAVAGVIFALSASRGAGAT